MILSNQTKKKGSEFMEVVRCAALNDFRKVNGFFQTGSL